MNKVQLHHRLSKVRKKAEAEVAAFARQGRMAAAVANEGYAGGYCDALQDVMLLLQGVLPDRRGWWENAP